jgi:hypothetical protein
VEFYADAPLYDVSLSRSAQVTSSRRLHRRIFFTNPGDSFSLSADICLSQ